MDGWMGLACRSWVWGGDVYICTSGLLGAWHGLIRAYCALCQRIIEHSRIKIFKLNTKHQTIHPITD
jgi:hypothetical protein